MAKRKFLQAATKVKRDAVRREVINGVEHIIISSYTLPDNIVMNGGFYPAEEIEKGYHTLERTLAPIEHPTDEDGNFLSASDPEAIHNFYAGAYNTNVRREGGRVHIDKVINVQEASKTDRGKRLLDRVKDIETNSNAQPIHTSVGVYLDVEVFDEIKTNQDGLEYSWKASNLHFDHDAILLDSVGAAQPNQGVGLAVNADGERIEVENALITETTPVMETMDDLYKSLKNDILSEWLRIEEIIGEEVIFETEKGFFQVPVNMDGNGTVTIVGIPTRVVRETTFKPKVNNDLNTGDAMKEFIVNALKAANVSIDGLTDEQLFNAYNELLQVNQATGDETGKGDTTDLQGIVANAVKPLLDQLDSLKAQLNANAETELNELATLIGNSDVYPGIDVDTAKLLPVNKLKEMAVNCRDSVGIPFSTNAGNTSQHDYDMPE